MKVVDQSRWVGLVKDRYGHTIEIGPRIIRNFKTAKRKENVISQ
jgi:hypothetical protein